MKYTRVPTCRSPRPPSLCQTAAVRSTMLLSAPLYAQRAASRTTLAPPGSRTFGRHAPPSPACGCGAMSSSSAQRFASSAERHHRTVACWQCCIGRMRMACVQVCSLSLPCGLLLMEAACGAVVQWCTPCPGTVEHILDENAAANIFIYPTSQDQLLGLHLIPNPPSGVKHVLMCLAAASTSIWSSLPSNARQLVAQ